MPIILNKFKIPQNADLSKYLNRSKKLMADYKSTAFKTSFLEGVINDKFEYTGNLENTILVENKKTKKTVALKVEYEPIELTPDLTREDWNLYTLRGKLVGSKHYAIERRNNSVAMRTGSMTTMDNRFRGIGTRLDQFQIERAIQLGFDTIPRLAQPHAIYFHTMMGFLPKDGRLYPVENNLEEAMQRAFYNLEEIDFEPILVEKDGKIYIDCNKTLANANLTKCKEFCEKYNKDSIKKIKGQTTNLELSGEELAKWKEIIQNHSLLDKLNYNYPKF